MLFQLNILAHNTRARKLRRPSRARKILRAALPHSRKSSNHILLEVLRGAPRRTITLAMRA